MRENSLLFPNGAPTDGEVTDEPSNHFTDLSDHFSYLSDHSTGLGELLRLIRQPRQLSDHFSGLGKLASAYSLITSLASANCAVVHRRTWTGLQW